MKNKTTILERPKSAFMSRLEVRRFLKVRNEAVLEMEALGFFNSVKTGKMYKYNYFSIVQFADDLVNNQQTLAKTVKQRQYLLNHFYQEK